MPLLTRGGVKRVSPLQERLGSEVALRGLWSLSPTDPFRACVSRYAGLPMSSCSADRTLLLPRVKVVRALLRLSLHGMCPSCGHSCHLWGVPRSTALKRSTRRCPHNRIRRLERRPIPTGRSACERRFAGLGGRFEADHACAACATHGTVVVHEIPSLHRWSTHGRCAR